MYIPRSLSPVLHHAVRQFPAILVTGPRQSGKTTFLRHEIKRDVDYISFDDPLERNFALQDPNGFLDRFKNDHVILDEIQYVPEILPYLKIRIDRRRKQRGKWLLTGSQQFAMMHNVSESLAGRIAILEILPFNFLETKKNVRLESAVWNGFYPEPSLDFAKRDLWIRSYIQTYIERDVRLLLNVKDLRSFETFLALFAARHGQTLNTAAISRDAGISLPTVKSWVSILEASYLCYLLPPYFNNYGKRLTKSPKAFFLDPAIVCDITRQPDENSALAGSMGGALFEGLIVSEAVKIFASRGRKPDIFFWRSHDGLEVDLIIQVGKKLHPVEIKLTATPSSGHLEPLNRFRELAGKDSATGLLVCGVDKITSMPFGNIAIPWNYFSTWLAEHI